MKKLLVVSAVAGAIASFAAPASAYAPLPFCVDSSAYIDAGATATANHVALEASVAGCGGEGPNVGKTGFVSDNIQGGYIERLVASLKDPLDPSKGLKFDSTTVVDLDTFKFGGFDINSIIGGNGTGLNESYDLYAVVTATGNISAGGTSFSPTGASVQVFLDLNNDTILADNPLTPANEAWGANPFNLIFQGINGGEDVLLGSTSTLLSATGTLGSGGGTDGFSVLFDDFLLTAAGEGFFIAPSPFHVQLFSDGDIDDGFAVLQPGVLNLQGNVNVSFVPEPGSVALAGLALIGLAATSRRRKA